MLRKIAFLTSLFCLLMYAPFVYAATGKDNSQQKLAASISQLPIIYLFDGMPPQPADCTVGNFGEFLTKHGIEVSLEPLDDNTFVLNAKYADKITKKSGTDHFVFLVPDNAKNRNAILARYFADDVEITGDQKNRVLWPMLSNTYANKRNLSKDYTLKIAIKGAKPDLGEDNEPTGSAKADDFADNQDDSLPAFDPDNPCGNVIANFPVSGDLRFVLLGTEKGYFPYYYSQKQNPDCGEEAKYVCAKVLKKQETDTDLEKAGVKAWEITIINQCKGVAAPG